MKKQIKLSRIHCAGCAEALEQKINEIEEIESASIDFSTKTIIYETEHNHGKEKEVREKIIGVVKKFDHTIQIVEDEDDEKQAKKEKIHKIVDISKIFICIVLAVVGFVLPNSVIWLKITLYILAYLCVGYEVLISAFMNLFKGKFLDENFLMTVATIGAFAVQEYVDAIAVMLFYSVGEFLEGLAVEKSKKRIKSLLLVKAETANLVTDDGEQVVDVSLVKEDSIIRIKAGEKVPLDCVVLEGNSYLNTSAVTGESKELFVEAGNEILSGSINGSGVLLCKVIREEEDSTVTKIIKLVENANKKKAKTERFITKFAKIYTPIVVGLSVLLACIPPIFGQPFNVWLYRALTFLVVSCPCALILSIPLGYFAGLGSSARKGVLIKGASHLETLAKADTVIFDKTGTLTYGDFVVSEIYATEDSSKEEVLELTAYAESFSNHRIAKSIVKAYGKNINTAWVEAYREVAGKGVLCELFNEECVVGNATLLKEKGIAFEEADKPGTVIYIAKSGTYLGYVLIVDQIKEDSGIAIKMLKENGIRTVCMFTGDNEKVASAVADELHIDKTFAGLLPEQKVEKISSIDNAKTVVFVGDGINDAPALATASIGVSMGGVGSDAAIETADVVLMTDNPKQLVDAVKIAKKTRKITFENIVFIMAIKIAVLALSAFGLAPMWLAIFADVGVCLLAVLNSLRVLILPKDKSEKQEKTKKSKTNNKAEK